MKSLIIFVCCAVSVFAANLPDGLRLCKSSSPNHEECTKKAIEEFLMKNKNGNKELGLNPLNPLKISELNLEGTGQVSVHQYYRDVSLHGLIDSKVNKFSFDKDECKIHLETFSPVIHIAGTYKARGRVLLFTINADGHSNHTLSKLKLQHNLSCEKVMKNGKEYINVTEYSVEIKPEAIVFYFDNLVNNNPVLGNEILNTLNENSLSVFEEVRALQEVSFGLVFQKLANNVFSKIPLDVLFPA